MKSNGQIIRSIITDMEMHPGDFEYDWQEFVLNRMKVVNEEPLDGIDSLLDKIDNQALADNIRERIIERGLKIGFLHYNQGFINGIKKALVP